MSYDCYSVGCTSHNACTCNSQCTCNTDARTCAAQRATNTSRVFSWTNTSFTTGTFVKTTDITELRSFLQQELNSRSSPSPADVNATTYVHPGSCSIQTTTWTGTVSVGNNVLATTFNQLVTLLNDLKTRATNQGATMASSNASNVTTFVETQHITSLYNILIESYKQCICVSKLVCTCHTLCACNTRCTSNCSCNATYCSCMATCYCYWYY
jgi:hypothetical protein